MFEKKTYNQYSYYFDNSNLSLEELKMKNQYKIVLSNLKKLFEMFSFNSVLEIYEAFYFALCSGALSHNRRFLLNSFTRKNVALFWGLEVINGCGNCKHIAAMLSDLYELYEYQTCLLMGVLDVPEDFKRLWNGDHAICCIKDANNFYYLNSTSKEVFSKEKYSSSKLISENHYFQIRYHTSALFNGEMQKEDFLSMHPLIKKDKTKIMVEDIAAIWRKVDAICQKNEDCFVLFFLENMERYQEISNSLKLIR